DLINHTAYPVTINEGELAISENGGPRFTSCLLGIKTFLSPHQPYPIEFNLGWAIPPEQPPSWPSTTFKVKGVFSHRHRITQEEIRQPLEGMLQCERWKSDHKWHATYTAFLHMNPERAEADQTGEQKAN
ncbi:MAG: hypothetical protein ABSG65_25815, partial [Bryobacteraceae bacterium]